MNIVCTFLISLNQYYDFKTSALQAFIPIPELCGNVAKVKSPFFSSFVTYSFSALRCWCSCEHRAAPHLCPFWGSPSRKVVLWYNINSAYARYLSTTCTNVIQARQYCSQLAKSARSTPQHEGRLCFLHESMFFVASSESEPSKVGYKSYSNTLWWEQSSSGEH